MAKIRINGDTSGYIEISAPAVAGSTSITLPATTGGSLLATDANGNLNVDSGVLYVDGVNNRVGIGTTSPGAPLEVNGGDGLLVKGSSTDSFIQSYATANNYLEFKDAGGAAGSILYNHTSDYLSFKVNGSERTRIDSSGNFLFNNATSIFAGQYEGGSVNPSTANYFVGMECRLGGDRNLVLTAKTGDAGGNILFKTGYTTTGSVNERMRVTETGVLMISRTSSRAGISSACKLQVAGGSSSDWTADFNNTTATAGNAYGIVISYASVSPNGTGNEFIQCSDSSAARFTVRSNGGLANYQANNVNLSDINTKKDISLAIGTWDCIKEWEIVNYRYKDQPDDADLNLGVIAQQVAESCPEVITVFQEATENEPEKLGIKEQQMYWMAIKALQEAQLRIEQLEATNASFEARLSALEVKP